jgi:thiamine transporter ThiT
MILRLTAYFSAMVFVASFQKINLKPIQSKLEYGISFYPNGFARIFKSFSEQELDKQMDVEVEGIDFPQLVKHIWIDVIWGTIFWFGIIPPTISLIFA